MNILDLVVDHNKRFKGNQMEELSDEQVVGSLIGIMFASIDTSVQTSTSALSWMNYKYPEWKDKIQNDKVRSLSQIEHNHSL